MYNHCKPIAVNDDGKKLMENATANSEPEFSSESGIIVNGSSEDFINAIASHRFWNREK